MDTKLDAEKEPSCTSCANNRMMLEKAWQTIANEYYDPTGNFSQAKWAKELLIALQVCTQSKHSMSSPSSISVCSIVISRVLSFAFLGRSRPSMYIAIYIKIYTEFLQVKRETQKTITAP